mmetsp:Transcript_29750/g.70137  ORF Transcript_29750/g.70137 Transcript_29750/m.70137 type:complete len:251 (-) Transcript_29750:1438-2190(-)
MTAPNEASRLLRPQRPITLDRVLHQELAQAKEVQAGSACNDRITLLAADIKRYDAVLLRNNEHAKGYAKPDLRGGPGKATKPSPKQVGLEDGCRMTDDFRISMLDQVQKGSRQLALIAHQHGAYVVVHATHALSHVLGTPNEPIQQRHQKRWGLVAKQGNDVWMATEDRFHAVVVASAIRAHCEQVLENRASGFQSTLLHGPDQRRHGLCTHLDPQQNHFALPARRVGDGCIQHLGVVLVDGDDHWSGAL